MVLTPSMATFAFLTGLKFVMENNAKGVRKRRSDSEIRLLLEGKASNRLSIKAFCALHGIHEATYYNWPKRYNLNREQKDRFISVRFKDLSSESVFAEIEIPGKGTLRLYEQVDSSWFKPLLSL